MSIKPDPDLKNRMSLDIKKLCINKTYGETGTIFS